MTEPTCHCGQPTRYCGMGRGIVRDLAWPEPDTGLSLDDEVNIIDFVCPAGHRTSRWELVGATRN